MASGALRLDNSSSQIGSAASALTKAFTGDAADEARAGYYGSEVALNRKKIEELQRTALGQARLQDTLTGGGTGTNLLGALAFSPEYLRLGPSLGLQTATLQPGATAQTQAVQNAQIGAGSQYTATYQGTQDELANRIKQANISAGPGYASVAERASEFSRTGVRVKDPTDATGQREIEIPRATWEKDPTKWGAAVSGPQAEIIRSGQQPVRVGVRNADGSVTETLVPNTQFNADPSKYVAPVSSPQVEQQNVNRQDNQWWNTGVAMREAATGKPAYPTRKEIAAAPAGTFIPPLSEAEVSAAKAQSETRTQGQAAYKVGKPETKSIYAQTMSNLNQMFGLTVDKDGIGGFGTGVQMPAELRAQLPKILANAASRYQLHGNILSAVDEAIADAVGNNPTFKSTGTGWFGGGNTGGVSDYKPGGTTPLPPVPRNDAGEVVRAPIITQRQSESTLPNKKPDLLDAAGAVAGSVTTKDDNKNQQELPAETKLAIARNLTETTPDKAKASAKKLIAQHPELRNSVKTLLKEHNIDTAGL